MAGITMQRTPFAIFLPFNTSAAILISSIRPLVQEPITAWSTFTSPTWSMVLVLEGRWGKDTVGFNSDKSITYVSSYSASSSASYTVNSRLECSFIYSTASSSTGNIPFFPPASIAMLQMVKRSSMERFLIPSPTNSMDLYRAPSTPIMPIICKITSLPLTHFAGLPTSWNLMAEGTLNQALPVTMPAAISVLPTPVENAPRAPYVHVWESAPMTASPATTSPFSGRRACSIPMSPTSK